METPLISVIVPVYNVEKYLDKCVQSLLAQTYPNYEIILVDDGSPDSCPAICDSYGERCDNITVFHKKNGGLSDARNYGVQRAKGDWIVFVDSDDYVLPCYLSDLWNLKEKHHADMAAAGGMRVDEAGNTWSKKKHFDSFIISGGEAIHELCVKEHMGVGSWAKLYPKSVLLQVPYPDVYYEDEACTYKILDAAGSTAVGDFNQNYKWVQRSGSITHSRLSEKHIRSMEICEDFTEYIDAKHPELDYLKPVFWSNVVWSVLACSMSRKEYRQIFKTRRDMFRRRLKETLACKKLPAKCKVKVFVLSTEPWICRTFARAVRFRKWWISERMKAHAD